MSILRQGVLLGGGGSGGGVVTHPNRMIVFEFDNGGLVLPVGLTTLPIAVPFAHEIVSWTMVSFDTVTGIAPPVSVQADVWRDSYASYPPVVGDSITAAAKPTITAATKATDSTLTGWSKTGAAGDLYVASIVSVTAAVAVALYLILDPN